MCVFVCVCERERETVPLKIAHGRWQLQFSLLPRVKVFAIYSRLASSCQSAVTTVRQCFQQLKKSDHFSSVNSLQFHCRCICPVLFCVLCLALSRVSRGLTLSNLVSYTVCLVFCLGPCTVLCLVLHRFMSFLALFYVLSCISSCLLPNLVCCLALGRSLVSCALCWFVFCLGFVSPC